MPLPKKTPRVGRRQLGPSEFATTVVDYLINAVDTPPITGAQRFLVALLDALTGT